MKISKIVSGGQAGADRGGLDAAITCKLPYGGWIPKGRRAEDGVVPETYAGLRETVSKAYIVRTEANVVDSDATLILCYGQPEDSSLTTLEFAQKHGKPYLAVDLGEGKMKVTGKITEWLHSILLPEGVINVAGARESKAPSVQLATRTIMIDVISRVNGELACPADS